MSILSDIHRRFVETRTKYTQLRGVESVAFWKLDLAQKLSDIQATELREEVSRSLIDETFCSAHVAAFFILLQTQLPSHSMFLWEHDVIPLLAGTGPNRQEKKAQLHETFKGDYPFRSSMRNFLTRHRRARQYDPGSPFWFVKATIGECALMGISGGFAADYFDAAWRKGIVGSFSFESLSELFKSLLSVAQFNFTEKQKVQSLAECMVPSALAIAQLARFSATATPPIEGWGLDSLLAKAKQNAGITIAALPHIATELIRERIGFGITQYSAEQIFSLFAQNPTLELWINKMQFPLEVDRPIPVAEALLQVGTKQLRISITDELGRTCDEVIAAAKKGQTGIWNIEGDFHWRIEYRQFPVPNPKLRRQLAQPVYSSESKEPDCWIWCGRDIGGTEAASSVKPLGRIFAWPTLIQQKKPAYFVHKIKMDNCDDGFMELFLLGKKLWAGAFHKNWIRLNMNADAPLGENAVFMLRLRNTDGNVIKRRLSFSWPMPSLFNFGRRVLPGQASNTANHDFVLFSNGEPNLINANAEFLSRDEEISKFKIIPNSSDEPWSIAISEVAWRFNQQVNHRLSVRLVSKASCAIDESRFSLSDDSTKLFFCNSPQIVISVFTSDSSFDLPLFFKSTVVLAGYADSHEPDVQMPLDSLAHVLEVEEDCGQIDLRIDTSRIAREVLGKPEFRIKKVAIGSWERSAESSGHSVEFLLLPFDMVTKQAITPTCTGGIRLIDSNKVFDDLTISGSSKKTIPVVGDVVELQEFNDKLPLVDLKLQTSQELPLVGFWPFSEACSLLTEFNDDLKHELGIVVAPANSKLAFEIVANQVDCERVVYENPAAKTISISDVLPDSLKTEREIQKRWLEQSESTIRCLYEDREISRITLDATIAATEFSLVNQGRPNPAGETELKLAVTAIPGFTPQRSLTIQGYSIEQGRILDKQVVVFNANKERVTQNVFYVLPGTGEFRLSLLSESGESLEAINVVLDASTDETSLDNLLEYVGAVKYTEGPLIAIYETLSNETDPWENLTFKIKVTELRDRIASRESIEYRLADTLLAFLEHSVRSISKVELIKFDEVPPKVLVSVGFVVMQLQFFSPLPIRRGLSNWIGRFQDATALSQDEKSDLMALSAIAQCLKPEGAYSGVDLKEFKLAFPARKDFVSFLKEKRIINGD